jgi:hypothetical protein
MTQNVGWGRTSAVLARTRPSYPRNAFKIAREQGFDVIGGHPEVGGARVIGELMIQIDTDVPVRVQQSRVARELARVELVRAGDGRPTEEGLLELASRLLLPDAPLSVLLQRGAELPELYAAFPFCSYELLLCRLAERSDLVATAWRAGQPTTRFGPPERLGPYGEPAKAERALEARARVTNGPVRGPGRSSAYAVREVGGPDVVTMLDASCALGA